MSDAPTDLEALLPGREVKCKGEDITVVPLFFGQYPKAIQMVRPLMTAVAQSGVFKLQKNDSGKFELQTTDDWVSALPLIMEHGGEALIKFFAFAIDKPREWFNTLPGDEGLTLAHAILACNRDFFFQKIVPLLATLGLASLVPVASDGEPSAPNSSDSATLGTASS